MDSSSILMMIAAFLIGLVIGYSKGEAKREASAEKIEETDFGG